MGFEETVLSKEEIGKLRGKRVYLSEWSWFQDIAKAQAEISFERGKDVGFEIGLEQGRAEGIRKVVDWIEQDVHKIHRNPPNDDKVAMWRFNDSEWQAKLKEWGIDVKDKN